MGASAAAAAATSGRSAPRTTPITAAGAGRRRLAAPRRGRRWPTAACSSSTSCPSSAAVLEACASRSRTARDDRPRPAGRSRSRLRFMLVAASNPCPCGLGDATVQCTPPTSPATRRRLRPAAGPRRHPRTPKPKIYRDPRILARRRRPRAPGAAAERPPGDLQRPDPARLIRERRPQHPKRAAAARRAPRSPHLPPAGTAASSASPARSPTSTDHERRPRAHQARGEPAPGRPYLADGRLKRAWHGARRGRRRYHGTSPAKGRRYHGTSSPAKSRRLPRPGHVRRSLHACLRRAALIADLRAARDRVQAADRDCRVLALADDELLALGGSATRVAVPALRRHCAAVSAPRTPGHHVCRCAAAYPRGCAICRSAGGAPRARRPRCARDRDSVAIVGARRAARLRARGRAGVGPGCRSPRCPSCRARARRGHQPPTRARSRATAAWSRSWPRRRRSPISNT